MSKSSTAKLLVDEVTSRIRDMIVSGQFEPGTKLSESVLAADLAVSTTPVREAIAALRSEGLVHVKPQSGTYVFDLSPDDLKQLCALRTTLEPEAVRLAVARPGCRLGDDLAAIVDQMRAAQAEGDVQRYLSLDTVFHEAIIHASENPYFIKAYGLISAKMAAMRYKLGGDAHHMSKSMEEHDQIAQLIRRRAIRQVEKILIGHIARKEGSYWEFLIAQTQQNERA
jgi:DNA-binding GntR family transcriptional regulator